MFGLQCKVADNPATQPLPLELPPLLLQYHYATRRPAVLRVRDCVLDGCAALQFITCMGRLFMTVNCTAGRIGVYTRREILLQLSAAAVAAVFWPLSLSFSFPSTQTE